MIENEPPPGRSSQGDAETTLVQTDNHVVKRLRDDPDDALEATIYDLPVNTVRETRSTARTRSFLAHVITVAFAINTILIVVGGLTGRFELGFVEVTMAAFAASNTAVAYFYFRRD